MADIDKITLQGTDYKIIDSTVPSWAKQSTKPTYNGSEVNYTGTTGSTVTANTTLNTAVQALDTAVNNRLKYQLMANEAAYEALQTKDSGTLYLIPDAVTKYTVSIVLQGTAEVIESSTINGVSYQESDFPVEVNGGESLTCNIGGSSMASYTVTMGGTTVATSKNFTIPNVTGDVVVTIFDNAPY